MKFILENLEALDDGAQIRTQTGFSGQLDSPTFAGDARGSSAMPANFLKFLERKKEHGWC